MSLVVKGASLLGEQPQDLYVDRGVLVAEEPTARSAAPAA